MIMSTPLQHPIDLCGALVAIKYMSLDRARYILAELVRSGTVSVAAFETAVEKRRAYIDEMCPDDD